MAEKEKKYFITIPANPEDPNAEREQFKIYQKDGKTFRVAIGKSQQVPEWIAKLAKSVGDVPDYVVA